MQTEIKYIDHTGTVKMKAVPIIGVAACDGSIERKYIEKLGELMKSGKPERFTDEQIAQIPSRIMR